MLLAILFPFISFMMRAKASSTFISVAADVSINGIFQESASSFPYALDTYLAIYRSALLPTSSFAAFSSPTVEILLK
jgi:hypothetical protein